MGNLLVIAMTRAFDVYRKGKNIDTIFYSDIEHITSDDVKRSLIDHDGYPYDIVVREVP